jgi:hypothetical protein
VIAAHLRRFNQSPEWNVRRVLSIQGFFMSSPHLHHSDKKFDAYPLTAFLPSVVYAAFYSKILHFMSRPSLSPSDAKLDFFHVIATSVTPPKKRHPEGCLLLKLLYTYLPL